MPAEGDEQAFFHRYSVTTNLTVSNETVLLI